MSALDEERSNVVVENRMKNCCIALAFEQQPETIAIQEAVKVLLRGLGEDINRDGIKKTPFRVAMALRQGTRGISVYMSALGSLILSILVSISSGLN